MNEKQIQEFERIRIKGELIPMEDGVTSVTLGKYIERYILHFEDKYHVVFNINDQFIDEVCYYWDIQSFTNFMSAKCFYGTLGGL